MVSKEIYELIQQNKVSDLYKKFIKYFEWIDEWADKMIDGDLLDENELTYMLDKSTAIFAKLCVIVNALESYVERELYNEESKFYKELDRVRTQDTSQAKAHARASVSDLRDYLADFKSYLQASQQNITTAQSRLKRLTVEKGARGVDFTGDINNVKENNVSWDNE